MIIKTGQSFQFFNISPASRLLLSFFSLFFLVPSLSVAQINTPNGNSPLSLERGQALARTACATCHLYPEPALLDRNSWAKEVLPKMRQMMGLDPVDYAKLPGGKLLEQQRPFPSKPLVTSEDWAAISQYYLTEAPPKLKTASPLIPTAEPEPAIKGERTAWREASPAVSMLQIDPVAHRLYVADALSRQLLFFNRRGQLQGATQLDLPAVHLTPRTNGFYLTLIGDLYPSDEPKGQVIFYGSPKAGAVEKRVLLKNLHRPVHTLVTDINGDGRDDLVVSSFGNNLGRLSWFENQGGDRYAEHVLIDRPGAIASEAVDLDKDGRMDLVVLMAQAWEGIYWLRNEGNGQYKEIPLLQWPPSWGSTSFQLHDFNDDGHPDLLVSNGDNGDFGTVKAPHKPYHGVRIYLNDGHHHFTEKFFLPVPGAYKAIAADFRGTGRPDIVVSAFFPDFEHTPVNSLILLTNDGGDHWKPSHLPEGAWGRWFVMTAGDLDGDGLPELVTGSYPLGPGRIPKEIFGAWQQQNAPVLIFRRQLP